MKAQLACVPISLGERQYWIHPILAARHLERSSYTLFEKLQGRDSNHKVCHPRCVYNKLGCVYTCLTQLYDGRYMYNLLHKDQLHVSALFIGHLQVDN